jgi:hypothetical protein
MELLEGARTAGEYLRHDGFVVINAAQVPTAGDLVAGKPYPDTEPLWAKLRGHGAKLVVVDANALALQEVGSLRGANLVVLGVLASRVVELGLPTSSLREALCHDQDRLRCFERGLAFEG